MLLNLKTLDTQDVTEVARLHSLCFINAWSPDYFQNVLSSNFGFGIAATDTHNTLIGFSLLQAIKEEAEILTLATEPQCRNQGIAHAILSRTLEECRKKEVTRALLPKHSRRGCTCFCFRISFK
jgi:[ribosomal protein S18]-alanine N-acetyltransferase